MNKEELYEKLHNHPRNEYLQYEPEKHEYHYFPSGDFRKTSEAEQFSGVTSLISQFKQPFDADKVAKSCRKNPNSKWYQMSVKDIKDSWNKKGQESIEEGNAIHDALEDFVVKGVWEDEFEVVYQMYENALDEHDLVPVYSEFLIYDEDYGIASMVDDLALTQSGELAVIDKKTYAKGMEYSSYGEKPMLAPFDHLQDSKYNHVCLQTGIYKKILQDKYPDLPIADDKWVMRITREECQMIRCLPMEDEVEQLMEFRK